MDKKGISSNRRWEQIVLNINVSNINPGICNE